jgi:peptide/nickel transport system permease protein
MTVDTQLAPTSHRVVTARFRLTGRLRAARQWLAVGVFGLIVLAAIFGPMIFRTPASQIDLLHPLAPPVWAGGTWEHPLGTDTLGRDLLAQVLAGARVSLFVAVTVTVISAVGGTLLGVLAGYWRGADSVISYLTQAQLSLPLIIIALALIVAIGPSVQSVIIAVALSSWVPYTRVVRSEVLALRRREFMDLAVVAGERQSHVIARHVVPNVFPTVIVLSALTFGQAIVGEASLSFLGLGVQPPNTSWGLMIAQSEQYVTVHPWLVLLPSIVLAVAALSANAVGDFIRDRLDPRVVRAS